eukprot:jgi/Botrbrau1/9726/Bobra.0388s0019.1
MIPGGGTGRVAVLVTIISCCTCLPSGFGRTFPLPKEEAAAKGSMDVELPHRQLQQAAGCIPFVQTGCPDAYPNPSCCEVGPGGPSRCAALRVAPGAQSCTNAKYCCDS